MSAPPRKLSRLDSRVLMTSRSRYEETGDIADELDRLDAGFGAFGDGEDQVDAVVRLFDDFRIDAHVVAAGAAIDFGDALGVGLHHRPRQRAPRLGLDFRRKLLVLDLLVALEGDAADHRVFNHGHHQAAAGLVDPDVLEQPGFDQRFQAVVDAALVKAPARTRLEIGANGFDFDAPVALDDDRGRRSGRQRATTSTRPPPWRRPAWRPRSGRRTSLPVLAFQQSCATRPCYSLSRAAPLRTGRFPFVAPLVANLAGAANGLSQCNFIFIPRRCPLATRLKRPLHDAARCRMSL